MTKEIKAKVVFKKYYTVRLEATVPCIITYRVFAEDEQDAIQMMSREEPIHFKPALNKKRDIKATVYDHGTSMIKFVKRYV